MELWIFMLIYVYCLDNKWFQSLVIFLFELYQDHLKLLNSKVNFAQIFVSFTFALSLDGLVGSHQGFVLAHPGPSFSCHLQLDFESSW